MRAPTFVGALHIITFAEAVLYSSDDFNYTPSTPLNGQNGGTGWGGPWEATGSVLIGVGSVPNPPVPGYGPSPSGNSASVVPAVPVTNVALQRGGPHSNKNTPSRQLCLDKLCAPLYLYCLHVHRRSLSFNDIHFTNLHHRRSSHNDH